MLRLSKYQREGLEHTGFERFDSEPEPQRPAVRVVSG